jgi:hypothetical protein
MPLIGMTRMYVRNPLIPIKFGFRERPVLGDPRSGPQICDTRRRPNRMKFNLMVSGDLRAYVNYALIGDQPSPGSRGAADW